MKSKREKERERNFPHESWKFRKINMCVSSVPTCKHSSRWGVGCEGLLCTKAKCNWKEIVDSSWCNIMFAVAFGNWIYILITRRGIVNDFKMCLFYSTLIDSSNYVMKRSWWWNFHGSWKENIVRSYSSAFRDIHCKQMSAWGSRKVLNSLVPNLCTAWLVIRLSRSSQEMKKKKCFDIVFL